MCLAAVRCEASRCVHDHADSFAESSAFWQGWLIGAGARGSGWNVIFLGSEVPLKVNQGHRRSKLIIQAC